MSGRGALRWLKIGWKKVCAGDRAAQLDRTKIMREFESNANCLILHKMFS